MKHDEQPGIAYVEDLQLGGLRILRAEGLPGYTTDAVLLADFAAARPGQRVCDLGTGTGILPLLLIGRERHLTITGVELDARQADMAARSVRLNGLEDSVRMLQGDLRAIRSLLPQAAFDLVICNPPYHKGAGKPETHQAACTWADVTAAAAWLLRPKGRLCVCCPAAGMLDMAAAMRGAGIEPKRLRLAASRADKAPYLCLMEGILGARPGLRVEPQLTMLEEGGAFTREARRIYHMEDIEPA